MDIYDYLDSLRRAIEHNPTIIAISDTIVMQVFDDHSGLFRARVFFWDGSNLTIDEVVDTRAGYPEILRYSYTYLGRDNTHVFRYDNAPHYPDLSTFPHHQHHGPNETPTAAEQPTLNQVLREIEHILSETSEA